MLSYFRYIPTGSRFYRLRRAIRSRLRLYMNRRQIVADIVGRMSLVKIQRWAVLDDDQLIGLNNTIGVKIRSAYGLVDERNPFVEISPFPDSDGTISNQYFPDNISTWVISQVRLAAQEYVSET